MWEEGFVAGSSPPAPGQTILAHEPRRQVTYARITTLPERSRPATLRACNLSHVPRNATMKLGLINSAWAQAGKDTAYGIRMTREIGFDCIDIVGDRVDRDVKERRLIQRECDRAGLPIVSIACVAVGLIDLNPAVQRFHLQRCRAYLDLAYEYQAKNVLLVLGE